MFLCVKTFSGKVVEEPIPYITVYTPCPGKKETSSFSTISLAFLDRFLQFLHQWKQE